MTWFIILHFLLLSIYYFYPKQVNKIYYINLL
nr:MAG TPA: hypothetical protein [Caudoviricetes sp.]